MYEQGILAPYTYDICIYHANCPDGFGAAWSVWKQKGHNLKYIPGYSYAAKNAEDYKDLHVLLVDYCWELDFLEQVLVVAKSITVVDHHDTAYQSLLDFEHPKLQKYFDMNKSGASLAWHLFNQEEAPRLIQFIEDYDLFTLKYKDTKAFNAALTSKPFDFEVWDKLDISQLIASGSVIERWMDQQIDRMLDKVRLVDFHGYQVPIVNSPRCFVDRMSEKLYQNYPFAIVWAEHDGRYFFSLRSGAEGVIVNKIAELYGGRGHPHAAVFSLKPDSQEFKVLLNLV